MALGSAVFVVPMAPAIPELPEVSVTKVSPVDGEGRVPLGAIVVVGAPAGVVS
jgi:hypothetical protein